MLVTDVLKGVGLRLEKGEIGVILGPSGSGKSTLMNIIGGIDRGSSGVVCVDGVEVSQLSDDRLTSYRREHVGFVFQFYNLVPNLTVGENVEVVSNISKSPLNAEEVLAAVDMLSKKHRFPRELSGGDSSASPSPAPSSRTPRCCCVTSPPARWITTPRAAFWSSYSRSTGNTAPPS